MQKSFDNAGERACDLKKLKSSERKHIYDFLKKSAMKKILELASSFDQDIYICLHDKKHNKVSQYSSDTKSFGMDQVNKLLKTHKKKIASL